MRTPTDATGFPGATVALINGGTNFVMCDLYTITLNGGTVLRYTNAHTAQTFNGNTWLAGPIFNRGSISHKIGTQVSTLGVTIAAAATDLINGVAMIPFIAGKGLDGATFKLERAFLPNWQSVITGTVIDFAGYVTGIKNVTRASVDLTASSGLVKLNVNMGPNLFQASCLNVLFDGNCGLARASYAVAGTASAGGTTSAFNTNLTAADGYFSQGVIKFTSGGNSGLQRTVRTFLHTSGAITLSFPLPVAPAASDAFTIYPGCDHTLATCKAKFAVDNSIHFRGTPFVPVPETAL